MDHLIIKIILALLIIIEIGYIIIETDDKFQYFKTFMNVAIVITFIIACGLYLQCYRMKNKVPKRALSLVSQKIAKDKSTNQTKKKLDELINS